CFKSVRVKNPISTCAGRGLTCLPAQMMRTVLFLRSRMVDWRLEGSPWVSGYAVVRAISFCRSSSSQSSVLYPRRKFGAPNRGCLTLLHVVRFFHFARKCVLERRACAASDDQVACPSTVVAMDSLLWHCGTPELLMLVVHISVACLAWVGGGGGGR
ncbi:unnamed protein product, partial [Ectocarpus sp. 12 AP-2014]